MPEISLDSYLKLTGAGNWHTWFEEFKGYATLNGIWKYVDPDGTREPEHDAPEPLTFERARERLLERAQKLSAKGTTPTPESSQAQMPTGDTPTSVREPTQDEIDREYNRLKDEFLIHSQAQTEAVNCITNLQRWVTAAVDPKIYDTARTKKKFDTNVCRDTVRALRDQLAPTDTRCQTLAANRYCDVLEAAKRSGVNPQRWI